jgi:DNA-binding XRE family transcriptional regulator
MSISQQWREAILWAHDGVCYYCGTADATHVDHIIPRVCGGTDRWDNLIAACLPCNLRKHRHRLEPDAERRAKFAARAAFPDVTRFLGRDGWWLWESRIYTRGGKFGCDKLPYVRAFLKWSQFDLARESGVTVRTIARLEAGQVEPHGSTLAKIRTALEAAGVRFIPAKNDSEGRSRPGAD